MKKLAVIIFSNPIFFGVGFVLLFLRFSNLFSSDDEGSRIPFNEKGSTLTEAQALSRADVLHQAMKNPGTKENEIYETLRVLSKPDFAKVYRLFGARIYNTWLGVTGGVAAGDANRDLIYWLNNELNAEEKRELSRLNPELELF
ncbi:hypothetical protein [Flagellimonas sp. CMM7]|uniref:hypothetical protein n=1 Tax=Flagellimonas sp. CMM7 TaxID=2654676 RepID=UPI0013D67F18|nr:hypothetical protein [Flagellimonas sp. CMM7]UII79567.1 hypothetical protein LV704_18140 [Flagellimonas sp. CMM7]